MRKYLNHIGGAETLVYALLAIAIAFALSMLAGMYIPKFRQERKKYLIYILLQGLLFVVFGAILYNLKGTSLNARFISVQVYMLVAGIAHLLLYRSYFKSFEAKAIYKEAAITVISAIFMLAFVILIVAHFGEAIYLSYHTGALLFFLVPTLCYITFEAAISIPVRLHKRWFYPSNGRYPAPHASDMRNIIILNFVFRKKENDKDIINFKVKAPRSFEFGRLFYYFINDYNEKNPNMQIHFKDNKNEPFGWYFYTKPKWFGSSDYIDPDLAIDTNNIKDGETIICQRI